MFSCFRKRMSLARISQMLVFVSLHLINGTCYLSLIIDVHFDHFFFGPLVKIVPSKYLPVMLFTPFVNN